MSIVFGYFNYFRLKVICLIITIVFVLPLLLSETKKKWAEKDKRNLSKFANLYKENFLFVDVSDTLQKLNHPPLLGHAQISFYLATLQIRCSKK